MMALLALPVARGLAPQLSRYEGELAELAAALIVAREADEPLLLDRLTRLEAEIGQRQTETDYRFSAAVAYHELVQRRIAELREERIQGLQTFREFTERRLAPAIGTCRTAAARLESLAHRAARAGQLLSTRVDVTLERQNQAVLDSWTAAPGSSSACRRRSRASRSRRSPITCRASSAISPRRRR